jgi:hypothetical protein
MISKFIHSTNYKVNRYRYDESVIFWRYPSSRIPTINNNINIYFLYSYCLKFKEKQYFFKKSWFKKKLEFRPSLGTLRLIPMSRAPQYIAPALVIKAYIFMESKDKFESLFWLFLKYVCILFKAEKNLSVVALVVGMVKTNYNGMV